LANIFTIQSDIAKGIANKLEAVISPEEKQLIEKRPTKSLQAYDFYKKGKEELNKFGLDAVNRNQIKRAEYLFKKALEYDSTFAQAYTGLANIYWKKNYLEENILKKFMDSMLVLANIALSYDEQLAEAYWIRGGYYVDKGNNNKAISEYDKSIRLNPNDWQPYYAKGWLYGLYNDYPESLENYQKAASLNHGSELTFLLRTIASLYTEAGFPDKFNEYNLEALYLDGDTSAYWNNLVYYEYCNGNFKKALELLTKMYRTDSTYDDLDKQIGLNYLYSGQFKESLKYLKRWTEKQKASGVVPYRTINHWIGYAYLVNGYKKQAESYFDKAMEYCQNLSKSDHQHQYDFDVYYQLASIYAMRGDKANAIENLKLFNQSQISPLMIARLIKVDHLFDSIRDEREFQQIVREVESKFQVEHEIVRKWLERQEML
jgi:tetratricopeptide (TPR) repeat protein